MSNRTTRRGFTLIELLLVIGIIAILAAIVIVAINPTKQLGDARNSQRRSDVNTILNAVYQYSIDHQGNFPNGSMTGDTTYPVCNKPRVSNLDCNSYTPEGADLTDLVPTYLIDVPIDPRVPNPTTTATGTEYYILKDNATNRVTVTAPRAENGVTISVSR